nr:MAG TPA: hypothetical protein [Caudoviricetes sp.]
MFSFFSVDWFFFGTILFLVCFSISTFIHIFATETKL